MNEESPRMNGWRVSTTPLKDSRTPRQPSPKASASNDIPGANLALSHRFIQGNGDRSCRRVAVMGEIAQNFALGNLEALSNSVKNALIGLVQEQPVYFVNAKICPE